MTDDRRNRGLKRKFTEENENQNIIVDIKQQEIKRGSFQFLKLLGEGGFGKVYLIRKKGTKKLFACKVLSKEDAMKSEQDIQYTKQEFELLKDLNSPFFSTLVAAFHTFERLYLVLEYIAGDTLGKLMNNAHMPEDCAQFYLAEIFIGICHLHGMNIAHRDLNKNNVMVARNGHLKICDFGLAKTGMSRDSITYTMCGTLPSMAPEQFGTNGYTRSVDWWSFGILMVEMIIGTNPFHNIDEKKTEENILTWSFKKWSIIHFPVEARSLANNLLTEKELRYGSDQIQNHIFFKSYDWDAARKQTLQPPGNGILFSNHKRTLASKQDVEEEGTPMVFEDGLVDPFEDFNYVNPNVHF